MKETSMKLLTTILSFSLLSAVLTLVSLAQEVPPDAAKESEAITIVRSGSQATQTEQSPVDSPVRNNPGRSPGELIQAWLPWIVLSTFVFLWGLPQVKALLDGIWLPKIPVPSLHNLIQRVPPVVPKPTC